MSVAIVLAARRLVALWDAETQAQADATRTSSPLATQPPRAVMTAARAALREAVHCAR